MSKSSTSEFVNQNFKGFQILEKLGCGNFASVYKVFDKVRNMEVAIKCLDKTTISKTGEDNIVREIKILKMIEHPHIVKMYDFYWDDRYVYIVLEYCTGGDLSQYINHKPMVPELICKKFMRQLVKGLMHLRSRKIYHYDLKPQNILIEKVESQLVLKISDFGLSLFADKLLEGERSCIGPRGSPSYMAPEMLVCDNYDPSLIDVWSLGVILYECLHGKLPIPHNNIEELIAAIKAKYRIKINHKLSNNCRQFLKELLHYNPKSRITFEQMLTHPFMKNDSTMSNYSDTLQDCEKVEAVGYENRKDEIVNAQAAALSSLKIDKKKDNNLSLHLTNEEFNKLKRLAKTTPKMLDALNIGHAAKMYFCEGNYQLALDNLLTALTILVPQMAEDPKGIRKQLLSVQVEEWLVLAENLKLKIRDDLINAKSYPEASTGMAI